jgi:hypothetical protein
MEWGDVWSSEARGTVSGWKGKKIDWRVERPVETMSKRRLLLVRYGPRESRW